MACSTCSGEDPLLDLYFPLHLNGRLPCANSPGPHLSLRPRWSCASPGKRAPAPTHRLSGPLPAPTPCCKNEVGQQPVTSMFSAVAQRRHIFLSTSLVRCNGKYCRHIWLIMMRIMLRHLAHNSS